MQSGPTRTALLSAILLAAYFICSALAIHAEGGEPPYFAITNARIFTISGAVIENGTVVVAKGLIQAVGADPKIPAEAWIIERLNGEHGLGAIFPAMVNAHEAMVVNMRLESLPPLTPSMASYFGDSMVVTCMRAGL